MEERRIRDSILNIIEYMKESEGQHFEESGKPKDHILNDVINIENWIDDVFCPLNYKYDGDGE